MTELTNDAVDLSDCAGSGIRGGIAILPESSGARIVSEKQSRASTRGIKTDINYEHAVTDAFKPTENVHGRLAGLVPKNIGV